LAGQRLSVRSATFPAIVRKVSKWRNHDLQRSQLQCLLPGGDNVRLYGRHAAQSSPSQSVAKPTLAVDSWQAGQRIIRGVVEATSLIAGVNVQAYRTHLAALSANMSELRMYRASIWSLAFPV
jgi:hypothetical protein